MKKRQRTAFHESFALNRPAIAQILRLAVERAGRLDYDTIRNETALGTNHVAAMPRFARGCGLLEPASFRATRFGDLVGRRDPHLDSLSTQWIMHYHLSAPDGPGPAFWHHLVATRLRLGAELEAGQLTRDIETVHELETQRRLAARTCRSTATIFIGTYTKSDSLGGLGILSAEGKHNARTYRVNRPVPPPLWAVAYSLADYWDRLWGQRVTVNLSEVTQAGGFADLFLLGSERFENMLHLLRRERVVDVYQVAPPYQLVRMWTDKHELLEPCYEQA